MICNDDEGINFAIYPWNIYSPTLTSTPPPEEACYYSLPLTQSYVVSPSNIDNNNPNNNDEESASPTDENEK